MGIAQTDSVTMTAELIIQCHDLSKLPCYFILMNCLGFKLSWLVLHVICGLKSKIKYIPYHQMAHFSWKFH